MQQHNLIEGKTLQEWDDLVVKILDMNHIWSLLDSILHDFIVDYEFKNENERELLQGMQVKMIRQDADLRNDEQALLKPDSHSFWDDAFETTTVSLRNSLGDRGIPGTVADLYVVAEIGRVAPSYGQAAEYGIVVESHVQQANSTQDTRTDGFGQSQKCKDASGG